mmetsp:Transcript_61814/g.146321  ORF Transcript_61814/g.146321 Transcript_61814/m.146321 type:complete len:241 (-) Transcript_61814:55-777(-)
MVRTLDCVGRHRFGGRGGIAQRQELARCGCVGSHRGVDLLRRATGAVVDGHRRGLGGQPGGLGTDAPVLHRRDPALRRARLPPPLPHAPGLRPRHALRRSADRQASTTDVLDRRCRPGQLARGAMDGATLLLKEPHDAQDPRRDPRSRHSRRGAGRRRADSHPRRAEHDLQRVPDHGQEVAAEGTRRHRCQDRLRAQDRDGPVRRRQSRRGCAGEGDHRSRLSVDAPQVNAWTPSSSSPR